LILVPTRELATQIDTAMAPLAAAVALRTMTVFGGVSHGRQIAELRAGVDIVVACPGRLADLIGGRHVDLGAVEITVLDEADHMADLGFLPAVRRLLDQTPTAGQRLLFSATLDSGVDVLVRRYLRDPVTHDTDPVAAVDPPLVHHVLYLDEDQRFPVLVDLTAAPGRAIVFTRTKHRARALTRQLVAARVEAVELHGNLGQTARDRNLGAFAAGAVTTLVATDIAARGIHVDDVRIVIHADPPTEAKAYLHRSGRTGRAGATGTIVTLSTEAQRREVCALTARAGIKPKTTRIEPGHSLLARTGPGSADVRPARPPRCCARPPNGPGRSLRGRPSRCGAWEDPSEHGPLERLRQGRGQRCDRYWSRPFRDGSLGGGHVGACSTPPGPGLTATATATQMTAPRGATSMAATPRPKSRTRRSPCRVRSKPLSLLSVDTM
jgi:superfamily II DNA/RNA helicase